MAASKITHWDDDYGLVSFRYEGELASALDHPGEYMELRYGNLVLEVWLGAYPTPDHMQNVIEDFRQCKPGVREGVWTWRNKQWLRGSAHL